MAWFSYSRKEGFPTQYADNLTPVTVDVLEAGFITAFVILLISFLLSAPSDRIHTTISSFIRITISLLIGLFLLLGNFGQEWEVGEIRTRTPYRAGCVEQINATIGIKVGLRSVNVTLTSQPETEILKNEIINYNERFSWTWDQGRFGFGPYAGHLQREFRAAQYRGVPTPILWVVEYFIIDGEGFRFGRFYRTAGWYCHIALWSAFACWLLALILFRSVIKYGAYCLATCGLLQFTANLLWLIIRNPLPLVIPFEHADIRPKFGASYWITFTSGLICLTVAIVIIIMDYKFDTALYTFFDVDPLNSYEGVAYITKAEQLLLRNKNRSNDMPLIEMRNNRDEDDENAEYVPVYVKRRSKITGPPAVIRSNKPKHLIKT